MSDGPVEARALFALYRNHPDTPPDKRYGARAHLTARRQREMLLDWAATQPDEALLDCRNLGTSSLAWIRAQRPPSGPSVEWQKGYDAGYREAQGDIALGVRVTGEARLDVERLREAAQAILDRCLDVFDPDDLDPESSFAMPVTLKARWVYALRAALATGDEP